jgi:pimeloyl-ACP methyl ester carboxylesterase
LIHSNNRDFLGGTPGVLFEQSTHGVATWTVPLIVRVSLGVPNLTPQVGTTTTEGWLGGKSQTVSHTLPPFAVSSLRQNGFDWRSALSLAMASELVYAENSKLIQDTVRGWGFNECHFIQKERTECFIAKVPGLALVVFRGTQGLSDWLSNLDLLPIKRPMGRVHGGFHEQFAAVQGSIEMLLPADGNTQIMLAGHSLGGAIATIAAAEWNKKYRVKAVYTFGQPAVGNDVFADFMDNNYRSNYYRFVNDADLVARVPPGYTHAGQIYHFDAEGNLPVTVRESGLVMTESTSKALSLEEFLALQENLRDAQRPEAFGTWISDHSIKLYIHRIANHINDVS